MKVVNLVAENYKRLKAIDITPQNNIVVVSGENGAGKTSVLDSIWAAVGGSDMTKSTGTTKPIRDGEKSASVKLDLGDLVVIRKWTASGSTLSVENKDGASYKSPQSILDGLIGKIAFDPLAFASMDEKRQRETLLGLVKLDIDLDKIAIDRQKAFDERTVINRDAKNIAAKICSLPQHIDGHSIETPISSVMAEIETAQQVINKNNRQRFDADEFDKKVDFAKQKRNEYVSSIEAKRKELTDMESALEQFTAKISKMESEAKEMLLSCDKLVDPDVEALKKKIVEIDESNKIVRNNKARAVLALDHKKATENADSLTAKIEALDEQKNTALKAAKYPIDGLGFSDTGVTFKGIPFSQCSAAERLKTSIAMAMAMNPKLRVIRITDGSLIDKKNMAIIEEMVRENDFQCWIEKVDESGKVGIYIEDGEVKTQTQEVK